jgi:hypothetical protein
MNIAQAARRLPIGMAAAAQKRPHNEPDKCFALGTRCDRISRSPIKRRTTGKKATACPEK